MSAVDELRALLDALAAAHEKATPGPWATSDPMPRLITGAAATNRGVVRSDVLGQCDRVADADWIVAACNAGPDLAGRLRAALDVLAAVEREATQAVRRARHEPPGSLARKYLTGRATALQETVAALTEALAGSATTHPTGAEENEA